MAVIRTEDQHAIPAAPNQAFYPTATSTAGGAPAVTAKLKASAASPLTLIAAPAGFGKTTLVSEWISQTEQPVAWLSLDEEDNDPGRFLLYLVTALRSVYPSIGEITLASLQAPQLPPITALLTPLLNDLHQLTEPLALVLDDYHLISAQPIHDALVFLVEHLPASLRFIITTRIDPPLPLARWRVRACVAEVRADDLRFDATETATFFNGVMGLQLTPDDIARLEARTEGWIAGLQLAALSMQGRADVSGFIQSFSGSHRHVFSYLIEEVLNQRPAGTLDFLLQTAILERFNADLCNIVTGRSDSQALLVKLEQANLFLIPLDDERSGIGIIISLQKSCISGCNEAFPLRSWPICIFAPARGTSKQSRLTRQSITPWLHRYLIEPPAIGRASCVGDDSAQRIGQAVKLVRDFTG
ncbi:MAG: hypothetical protein R2932_45595 [Caldilineaceae bacterium]